MSCAYLNRANNIHPKKTKSSELTEIMQKQNVIGIAIGASLLLAVYWISNSNVALDPQSDHGTPTMASETATNPHKPDSVATVADKAAHGKHIRASHTSERPKATGNFLSGKFSINQLLERVKQGEPTASRDLVRLIKTCRSLGRFMKNTGDAPTVSTDAGEQASAAFDLINLNEKCADIPKEYEGKMGELMMRAAKAGDKYALLNLRFYGPSDFASDPERLSEWQNEMILLHQKRGADAEVACNLANMYATGRGLPKDTSKAIELYSELRNRSYARIPCVERANEMIYRLSIAK